MLSTSPTSWMGQMFGGARPRRAGSVKRASTCASAPASKQRDLRARTVQLRIVGQVDAAHASLASSLTRR